jgi:Fic family protein
MDIIFIFIAGAFLGALAVFLLKRKNNRSSGLMQKQSAEKQEHIKKIMDYIAGKDKIANDDIQKLLGVSDSTAQRYLNELEGKGVLKQVGEAGQGIFYSKQ